MIYFARSINFLLGKGKAKDPIGIFTFWDANGDGAIDIIEVIFLY